MDAPVCHLIQAAPKLRVQMRIDPNEQARRSRSRECGTAPSEPDQMGY
jgi:hypothetical protein